eukprot:1178849-Prorocentrum_minimum.AAC.4
MSAVELSLVVASDSTGQEHVAASLAVSPTPPQLVMAPVLIEKDTAPARPTPVSKPSGEIELVEVQTKVKTIHDAAAEKVRQNSRSSEQTPTFAFVNGRAGGGKGLQAIKVIQTILSKDRVFNLNDLAKQNTTLDKVLASKLAKSEMPQAKDGRTFANSPNRSLFNGLNGDHVDSTMPPLYGNTVQHMWNRFSVAPDPVVVIAAGGDGTVNWVMNSLIAVQDEIVPFVVVPLPYGTGNDLHRAFGWGSSAPSTSKLRKLVLDSRIPDSKWNKGSALLDTWELTIDKCKGKSNKMQNYFSCGLMADMALGVDNFRNANPKLTKSAVMMKNVYAAVGAKKLVVKNPRVGAYVESLIIDGKTIPVPSTVKDIIVLNIPSMISGVCLRVRSGMSPWRTAKGSSASGGNQGDAVDDGKVEVGIFRSSSHGVDDGKVEVGTVQHPFQIRSSSHAVDDGKVEVGTVRHPFQIRSSSHVVDDGKVE